MMTKKAKIIIGSVGAVALISSFYFFVWRKRRPKLDIIETDFVKRYADVKFGKTTNRVSEFNGGTFTAGKGYDEDLYSVTHEGNGKGKTTITVYKNGEIVEKKIIDFDSNLITDR